MDYQEPTILHIAIDPHRWRLCLHIDAGSVRPRDTCSTRTFEHVSKRHEYIIKYLPHLRLSAAQAHSKGLQNPKPTC